MGWLALCLAAASAMFLYEAHRAAQRPPDPDSSIRETATILSATSAFAALVVFVVWIFQLFGF